MCFLPLEDIKAKHFQTVHNLPHFTEFQNNKEVVLSKNRSELIENIHLLVEKSKNKNFEDNIKTACKYFVEEHKDSYDSRLLNLVEKISNKKK